MRITATAPDTEPLAEAATWISTVMLGPVATAVAIIAIAAVGLLMLSGRICWRRGSSVLLGCFILFSAQSIALAFGGLIATKAEQPIPVVAPNQSQQSYRPAVPSADYDPYAGAALPSPKNNDL